MSWTTVLARVGGIAAAFIVGAVNPATIIARILGKDLATSGSGNPGATNAGRVLGRRWGIVVGVLDVLKGLLPAYVAGHWFGAHAAYAVGLAAVLGHIFSPFLHGRGGKGVATTFGVILGVHPWVALVIVVAFVIGARLSRVVATGSILAAIALLVLAGVVAAGRAPGDVWTVAWLTALGVVVLWRHERNIRGWWRLRRAG